MYKNKQMLHVSNQCYTSRLEKIHLNSLEITDGAFVHPGNIYALLSYILYLPGTYAK